MARFFAFPFDDKLGDELDVQTPDEFIQRYDEFFAVARRPEPPHGVPTATCCSTDYGGYVDREWLPGAMVAERSGGRWRWVKREHAP